MSKRVSVSAIIIISFFLSTSLQAEVFNVTSQQEFDNAHDTAALNDTIVWNSGTYSDIFMDIDNDRLFIMAEELGGTIFTGASRVDISSDYITLQGFQFLNGDIGTRDVINTRGSFNIFTQINIRSYTCYKYLRVREQSQFCEITFCNFENRLNLDDQNILSILVDRNNPGYHKIQFCSFKNFAGTGNDLGIEPIRIGVSSQADFNSRTVVEFCYFTQCNGDGEIISSKAGQNVYRFNTFENNPLSELVLRHGSENIVYGNFFVSGKGGVRVREGQDHYIYNNYFFDLEDRAIYLQNDDSDPLDNINIAFNTIVDCDRVRLGGNGNDQPTGVTFANNIFSDPENNIFDDETGTETWVGNISNGPLGIPMPENGMTLVDPQLQINSEGFFGLAANSPAINAAQSNFDTLPQFPDIAEIDTEVLFDLMGQARPSSIEERDLGCNEFPHNILITPRATEENTGPSYNTSTSTSVDNRAQVEINLMEINPNPVFNDLNITIFNKREATLKVDIFNIEGKRVFNFAGKTFPPGRNTMSKRIGNLQSGVYIVHIIGQDVQGDKVFQSTQFVKSN